ncbi:MAG: hypothetical protein HY821_20290 [Acidobacteria bacterium]|nr:hypothetical protein [Acidobacteriota bacterium]
MSSRILRGLAAAVALILLGLGALTWWRKHSRPEPPAVLRVAVLPADNQSGDPSLDWVSPVLSYSLSRQLEGSPRLLVFGAGSDAAATAAGATHHLESYLTRQGQNLELHFSLHASDTQKETHHGVARSGGDEPSPLLNSAAASLASVLGMPAPSRSTAIHSSASARALAAALNEPASALPQLEAAVAADPACGWCWLSYVEASLKFSGPEQARTAIGRSKAKAVSLDAVSRARLDLLESELSGDTARRVSALERLAAALPSDASAQSDWGLALTAQRQYARSADVHRRAMSLQPARAELWNLLAYDLAYAGNFADAQKAIQRYASMDSNSANPPDSEGEIALMAGEFAPAARAFAASYQRDKSFNDGDALEKAALAHLLNGERDAAGALLERYLKDRLEAGDPWVMITRARWESITGRTAPSEARLAAAAADRNSPLAPVAASMLALRQAAAGEFALAARTAAQARVLARNPSQAYFAVFALAAVDPASAQSISDPALQADARAFALTLRSDWPAAIEAWKAALVPPRGGVDAPQREMLAYCLVAAGRAREAAPYVAAWPILTRTQAVLYDYFLYPNLLYVRAEVARATQKNSEAQRFYDLYLQYAGDRPDAQGRQARARQAARL